MIRILWLLLGFVVVITWAQAQHSSSSVSPVPKALTSTVAGLPTCNSAAEGTIYAVTDALAPVGLATVAGSGAVHVLVFCNNSVWTVL